MGPGSTYCRLRIGSEVPHCQGTHSKLLGRRNRHLGGQRHLGTPSVNLTETKLFVLPYSDPNFVHCTRGFNAISVGYRH